MGNLRDALKGALNGLEGAVKDLSTIEVTTLTGDIKLIFDGSGNINLKDKIKNLDINSGESGSAEGSIEVIAHTQIDFDLDSVTYINKNTVQGNRDLLDIHNEAVATSQAARQSFLRFVKDFLGNEA
jgi:hypothetical protein